MFKRIIITLAFVTAFSTVGMGLSNRAQAWRGGYYGRPYGAYYAPRAVYYGPAAVPYRAYYGPRYAAPYYPAYYAAPAYPAYYAAPAYPVYYGGYYGPSDGVNISIGF